MKKLWNAQTQFSTLMKIYVKKELNYMFFLSKKELNILAFQKVMKAIFVITDVLILRKRDFLQSVLTSKKNSKLDYRLTAFLHIVIFLIEED